MLGGIVVFLLIGVLISNWNRNKKNEILDQENKIEFSKSILGHFSNYKANDVIDFKAIDTFSSGSDVLFLNNNEELEILTSDYRVINNSSFDAILLSFDIYNDKIAKSYYIKKSDTVNIRANLIYLCLGNELGIFSVKNATGNLRKNKPRFKKLYNQYDSFDQMINISGDIELYMENNEVWLRSDKTIYERGRSAVKMKIQKIE